MDGGQIAISAIIVACTAITGFLAKRFIDQWDKSLDDFEDKLEITADRIEEVSKTQSNALSHIQKEFRTSSQLYNNRVSLILSDLKETRLLLDQVREQLKSKDPEEKELKGKIIWILDRYPVVEKRISEISAELGALKSTISGKKKPTSGG